MSCTYRVHFVGIGGIGMSSLAQLFVVRGALVTGSDQVPSVVTKDIEALGVDIHFGHADSNIASNLDLVVHTAAVSEDNIEILRARELGIAVASYSETLGKLTHDYYTVSVAGSHGKSTTTSLIAVGMIAAGLDPTVIVGTRIAELGGGNFRLGRSRYLLIEADEYNRAFHRYVSDLAVITNVDQEHLDTYGDIDGVIAGFRLFCDNVRPSGTIIADTELPNVARALDGSERTLVHFDSRAPRNRALRIPGQHNRANAEAAAHALQLLGVSPEISEPAMAEFKGAWRRLELLTARSKFLNGATVITDYAHHPTEVRASLAALRERFPSREVICVFQPHQEDRLTLLFHHYLDAFRDADQLLLLPVYRVPGRDGHACQPKTSNDLYDALIRLLPMGHLKSVYNCIGFEAAIASLEPLVQTGASVLVFMAAGNLDSQIRSLVSDRE
jgi:UDP-N-acetylmuramate--alanine ligase